MIKVNCLSCGHSINLDDAYSDYEGQVKCFTCSTLLEVRLEEGNIKSVKTPQITRSQEEPGYLRERHDDTAQQQTTPYGAESNIHH